MKEFSNLLNKKDGFQGPSFLFNFMDSLIEQSPPQPYG